jgi:hypothetical protein
VLHPPWLVSFPGRANQDDLLEGSMEDLRRLGKEITIRPGPENKCDPRLALKTDDSL